MIIELNVYENGNVQIIENLKKLCRDYNELFLAVIAHGSVGSDEIINYSDFDGLLIIKDEFKGSKGLNAFILESMGTIFEFDPLQHHGWFIIYESQLNNYPQHYLPYEILNRSKLIYPEYSLQLNLSIPQNLNYVMSFSNLSKSLEGKILRIDKIRTAFQLKSFLSQVMLLPAMYYSAKNQIGIDKKSSFTMIHREFSREELKSIDIASEIRSSWDYKIGKVDLFCLSSQNKALKELARRYTSKKMKNEHHKLINSSEFKEGLLNLIHEMRNEIN